MDVGRRAIVSVVIGKTYHDYWTKYARHSWFAYAQKFNLELLIFDQWLDETRPRSAAWQKLLLLDHPRVAPFDQVLYLDADVVINVERAPLVFDGVPSEKIGAVVDKVFLSQPLFKDVFARTCAFE